MIDKEKLLNNFKQDFKEAKEAKTFIEKNINRWKDAYNAKPLGNEVDGKSKFVSKDIKKLLKYQLPILLDPFVSTPEIVKCRGLNALTVETAEAKENLLNYYFCRNFDRYNFMKKTIKLLQKESAVVIRTGWKYETKKQKVFKQVQTLNGIETIETEVEVPYINEPTAELCKFENIFTDIPSNGEEPDFIIHRFETTLSNLRENKHWYNQKFVEQLAQKVNGDVDAEQRDSGLYTTRTEEQSEYGRDSDFDTTDKSRQKVMVYEYWGKYDINEDGIAESIVCCWSGDVVLKLEDNPYPDNKIPFIIGSFDPEPFQLFSDSAIEDLTDNSKLKTLTLRGLIENLANANMGQTGIQKGALDPLNLKKYYSGQNFLYNKNFNGEIWQSNYNQLSSTPFNMLQMFDEDNETLSGITKNAIGEKTQNISATQSSQLENATQRRMLDLVRNISNNIVKPILIKWLAYSTEFLDDENYFYITGSKPVKINRNDLIGRVHMEMQVTTQGIDDDKSRRLAFLLQTSQQAQDPEVTKMLYIKLLKLDKMFEEAKRLEEYKPQPDPFAEEEKQLELEMKKAEIAKIYAEIKEKQNRASKVGSEKDLKDLEYIDKATGKDHEKELDKIGANALASHQEQVTNASR